MIIVDASVVAEALRDPSSEQMRIVLTGDAAAPAHVDAEVLSVIRGLVRGGHLAALAAPSWVHALATAPLERLAVPGLLETAATMFDNLTAHDALYVAAALRHDAPLSTRDRGMAAVAVRLGVEVVDVSA